MVESEKQKPHATLDLAHGEKSEPEGAPDLNGTVAAEWRGQTFRVGERVVIDSDMAGTFKPEATGHTKAVLADYGQRGTVIEGVKRLSDSPEGPIEILKVKWDRQRWLEADETRFVYLNEFIDTIHVSYLAHIFKPG